MLSQLAELKGSMEDSFDLERKTIMEHRANQYNLYEQKILAYKKEKTSLTDRINSLQLQHLDEIHKIESEHLSSQSLLESRDKELLSMKMLLKMAKEELSTTILRLNEADVKISAMNGELVARKQKHASQMEELENV